MASVHPALHEVKVQAEDRFHDRRVVRIENEKIRVSVTAEGGHIAELLDKETGVNPLWVPPWPSIEVSSFIPGQPRYGNNCESRLLAGIMGHSLCLDMFGPPSAEEQAAGLDSHGEAGVVEWSFRRRNDVLTAACMLPAAQLRLERRIRLEERSVIIRETVTNLSSLDRPIAWTQHVTLGPPFLEQGQTQFRASATRSQALGSNHEFQWPLLPGPEGNRDLRVYTNEPCSGGYTAHLMNPQLDDASFWAWSPRSGVLIGYIWKPGDFPWLGIWEENCSRTHAPWQGRTLARGMEFGVSPFPETRRQMMERGRLFGTPCFRWLGAGKELVAEYYAAAGRAPAIPETLSEFAAALELD